jgi:hypothetical protein
MHSLASTLSNPFQNSRKKHKDGPESEETISMIMGIFPELKKLLEHSAKNRDIGNCELWNILNKLLFFIFSYLLEQKMEDFSLMRVVGSFLGNDNYSSLEEGVMDVVSFIHNLALLTECQGCSYYAVKWIAPIAEKTQIPVSNINSLIKSTLGMIPRCNPITVGHFINIRTKTMVFL